jgi:hypothetical protein
LIVLVKVKLEGSSGSADFRKFSSVIKDNSYDGIRCKIEIKYEKSSVLLASFSLSKAD